MKHDAPLADEPSATVMQLAHMVAFQPRNQPELPRYAIEDTCPVCCMPVIVRDCKVICTSGMCRWRVIETCDGS